MKLREFMSEKALVDRWAVMRIAMLGAFVGSLLAVTFMLLAVVI